MTKRRILIVEDEAVTSVMLEKTLKELGYEVVGSAFDGMEAIELAQEKQPDLILMDIRIQGDIDGIETAKRIYQQYNIPSIYLTAHSDDDTIKRAVESGPFGYLIKPFKERELYSNIEMVIHKHKLYRTTTAQGSHPPEEKTEPDYESNRPPATSPRQPMDIRMGILAVQALPHPVMLLNIGGTVVYNNPATKSFLKAVNGKEQQIGSIKDLPEIFQKIWMSGKDRFKEGRPFSIAGPLPMKGIPKRYKFEMIPLLEKGVLQFVVSAIFPESTEISQPASLSGTDTLLDDVIMQIREIGFLASTEESHRMRRISLNAGNVVKILNDIKSISYPENEKKKIIS